MYICMCVCVYMCVFLSMKNTEQKLPTFLLPLELYKVGNEKISFSSSNPLTPKMNHYEKFGGCHF